MACALMLMLTSKQTARTGHCHLEQKKVSVVSLASGLLVYVSVGPNACPVDAHLWAICWEQSQGKGSKETGRERLWDWHAHTPLSILSCILKPGHLLAVHHTLLAASLTHIHCWEYTLPHCPLLNHISLQRVVEESLFWFVWCSKRKWKETDTGRKNK